MDVGSVGLIGFAVALTLALVRPSVAVRLAKRNKRPAAAAAGQAANRTAWCYMGDQGN